MRKIVSNKALRARTPAQQAFYVYHTARRYAERFSDWLIRNRGRNRYERLQRLWLRDRLDNPHGYARSWFDLRYKHRQAMEQNEEKHEQTTA